MSPTSSLITTNNSPTIERAILTRIAGQERAFPSRWVEEILEIERSRILKLPFYQAGVLGIVHHRGQVLTLVQTEISGGRLSEILMVVYLGSARDFTGIGIIIDQVLGSITGQQLQESTLFDLASLPASLWQPQRWVEE